VVSTLCCLDRAYAQSGKPVAGRSTLDGLPFEETLSFGNSFRIFSANKRFVADKMTVGADNICPILCHLSVPADLT
jgi:hypothetical protein